MTLQVDNVSLLFSDPTENTISTNNEAIFLTHTNMTMSGTHAVNGSASYNVSSYTDVDVGRSTVSFTHVFLNNTYCIMGSATDVGGGATPTSILSAPSDGTQSTLAYTFGVTDTGSTFTDSADVSIMIVGSITNIQDVTTSPLVLTAPNAYVTGEFIFVNYAEAGNTTGNVTCNVPSGVQDGDLMFALKTEENDVTSGAETGWTTLVTGSPSTSGVGFYYRIASSEPASYTFTNSGGGGVVISAFRGDFGTPLLEASLMGGGSPQNINPTLTNQTGVLFFFAALDGVSPFTVNTVTPTPSAVVSGGIFASSTDTDNYFYIGYLEIDSVTSAEFQTSGDTGTAIGIVTVPPSA